MNQTPFCAPSTIAMTCVSLLTLTGPLDLEGLWSALVARDFEIDRGPLQHALDEAASRRLVVRNGDVFSSTLPDGWVVRSRAPEHVDPTGWKGWVAHSADGRKRVLSDLQVEPA